MHVRAHSSRGAPASSTAPSTRDGSSGPTGAEAPSQGLLSSPLFGKDGVFSWRIMGGVFASLLVIGWVFIVVILIQEEKWQLVLVAWLLLYAAAHFCYWYFKRHHLLSLHSQICRRVRSSTNTNSVRALDKPADAPPSYEDVIKSEHPPPAYCSVVIDTSKCSPRTLNKKFTLFSLESLPNVFGRASPSHSACPSTSRKHGIFTEDHREVHIPSYSPTISGSIADETPAYRWGTQEQASPPSYDQSCAVDVESRAIGVQQSRSSSCQAHRGSRSVLRMDSLSSDGAITPILAPIHNHVDNRVNSPLPHSFGDNPETRAGTSRDNLAAGGSDTRDRHRQGYQDIPDNLQIETRRNSDC